MEKNWTLSKKKTYYGRNPAQDLSREYKNSSRRFTAAQFCPPYKHATTYSYDKAVHFLCLKMETHPDYKTQ
jgi:hypothetical protein